MEPTEREGPPVTRADEGASVRAQHRLFRYIGEHVSGFYAAVGASLLVAATAIVAALALFGIVAGAVMGDVTRAVDEAILRQAGAVDSPLLDTMALEVTALGGGVVAATVALVASALLWITRHRWSVLILWAAILGGVLMNTVLKSFFDRTRPDVFEWRVPYAGQTSFPSGHSMNAMVAYATLAYLIVRLEPTRLSRWLTGGVAVLVILMVGASRVYLGVHYPTDVVAGFLAGLGWAVFCAVGVEALRYFRGRNPGIEAQERDLDGRSTAAERG
jgi:undecaprenyl-diphosphatase